MQILCGMVSTSARGSIEVKMQMREYEKREKREKTEGQAPGCRSVISMLAENTFKKFADAMSSFRFDWSKTFCFFVQYSWCCFCCSWLVRTVLPLKASIGRCRRFRTGKSNCTVILARGFLLDGFRDETSIVQVLICTVPLSPSLGPRGASPFGSFNEGSPR